jgi:penicillin-binding protein 1A
VRVARGAGLAAIFALVALLGTASGVLLAYADDLPAITALDDYRPNTITRLTARDGQVIGEFATQRRVVVAYDDIAPVLRHAIIATEDATFERHFGLNATRILVTLFNDVVKGQRAGASTITQQLARNLFPIGFDKTIERKVKEAVIAIQLERRFTKPEIFTFYANQIYFGHGAYGVEAAARLYFNKSAKSLEPQEAALIAAIIQAPERLSPFVESARTLPRRNYVLQRMVDEGFLTPEAAGAATALPIRVVDRLATERPGAAYFVEDVRKVLEQRYGAAALYEAGLHVETTLDAVLQRAAEAALDAGLRRVDKRRSGYRKPTRNLTKEGLAIGRFRPERWARPISGGDIVPAVVLAAPRGTMPARVRIADQDVDLARPGFTWTRRASAADLFSEGDVIEVRVGTVEAGRVGGLTLEQAPVVEGALLAIDNATGEIRAMVGGFSFARSKFNRATQARRQVGSLFKPIVYAAAIDSGFTAASTFIDEPVSYVAGPNQPPYEPLNYDRKFEGAVTLRRALEQSRNIPAVKAMADVGPARVVEAARRLGLTGSYQPYLSLALGAAESTLLEMTSAYSAFANQGVRMVPHAIRSVTDREGNVLEQTRPDPREALRADTAFLISYLLRGVVEHGTATAAAALQWPLAGKTGTMDEYTDAWFIGFDPNITVGVWVGYDEKKPLGYGETGAATALPIWIDFMRTYVKGRGTGDMPPEFEAPGNIVFVTLPSGLQEAFINGTQPDVSDAASPLPVPASDTLPPAAIPAP